MSGGIGNYAQYPFVGGSGGVPIYSTFGAFPPGTAPGQLAVAADTGVLYEWNGSAWVAIASPGAALSIGSPANGLSITSNVLSLALASTSTTGALSSTDWNTFNNKQSTVSFGAFGSTPNADGGGISGGVITLEPADATHPGGVSISAQAFAGTKEFTNEVGMGGAPITGTSLYINAIDDTLSSCLVLNNTADAVNQKWDIYVSPADGHLLFFNEQQSYVGLYISQNYAFGTGNTAPKIQMEANYPDSSTTTTDDPLSSNTPSHGIRNTDGTVNNFETLAFVNNGPGTIAKIIGVNEDHNTTGSQTGHLEFYTAAAGSLTSALVLKSTQVAQMPHYRGRNFHL